MKYFLVSISYMVLKQKYSETYAVNALSMAESEMKIESFFANKGISIKIRSAQVAQHEEIRVGGEQTFYSKTFFEEHLESGKIKRIYSHILIGAPDFETAYSKTREWTKSAAIPMFIHTVQEKKVMLEDELLADAAIVRKEFNEAAHNLAEQIKSNGADIDKKEA